MPRRKCTEVDVDIMAPRIGIGLRASRPNRPLEPGDTWELARLGATDVARGPGTIMDGPRNRQLQRNRLTVRTVTRKTPDLNQANISF